MVKKLNDLFVYGTLKRGQCRDRCWPRQPARIQEARVRGSLFDLGPYPAMTAGDDWVLGEVWSFAPVDVERVLEVIDQIEGFGQSGERDLYHRVTVDWFDSRSFEASGEAMTYHYVAIEQLDRASMLLPDKTGTVQWPST